MTVVLIGSGNVATVLGKIMMHNDIQLVQVISQNYKHATELGNVLNIQAGDDLKKVVRDADFYVIAVSDSNIEQVAAKLPSLKGVLLHTAGSISRDILKPFAPKYGVLYPLQTLNKHMQALPQVPVMIDGNTDEVCESIKQFANIWAHSTLICNDQQRLNTHLAAVVVNNFTNHLMALTEEFCVTEGIDFSMLLPLIHQTVQNIGTVSATQLQTGPAARGDIATVDKHLQLLTRYPLLRNLYLKISESIIVHKRKNQIDTF